LKRSQDYSPDREDLPHSAFPFINPFAPETRQNRPSPPVSRPVTPKSRLKSLENSGFKTMKGRISTPNLRQIALQRELSKGPSRPTTGNLATNARPGLTKTGSSPAPPHSSPCARLFVTRSSLDHGYKPIRSAFLTLHSLRCLVKSRSSSAKNDKCEIWLAQRRKDNGIDALHLL
jgi:hypothetical protein